MEFLLRKFGHIVLNVSDLDASARFCQEVMGLRVTDRYPDSMVPGGMVFLCVGGDHHGVALVAVSTTSLSRWDRSTRCSAPARG